MTSLTPIFRNITFSNITATSVSGYPVGILWARTELPATNIVFNKIHVTGNRNFCVYNVSGAQFIDSTINVSANTNTFALYNAQVIITNSVPAANLFSFDGLTTNGYGNSFTFYNAQASLKSTNDLGAGPVTLSRQHTGGQQRSCAVQTNLDLQLHARHQSRCQVAVVGNLMLGGTNNIAAGNGFTNGSYTLMTYAGTLSGSPPVLASVPAGYSYSMDTSTAGQVNLIVSHLLAPTNLSATASHLLVNLTMERGRWREHLQFEAWNGQWRALPGGFQRIDGDQLCRCGIRLERGGIFLRGYSGRSRW